MKRIELIKLDEDSDIGMRKLTTDAKRLSEYAKRKYRQKHPKELPPHIPYILDRPRGTYLYHSKHIFPENALKQAKKLESQGFYVSVLDLNGDIVVYKRVE